jgi:hypothetical protein
LARTLRRTWPRCRRSPRSSAGRSWFGGNDLREAIAGRIQEVADCANGTHEAGYAERHVDRESEQDSPAAEVLRQGPNTPLSNVISAHCGSGPSDLDKVLSLARGYERFEHGREEHVSPYDSARAHLRDLAGPEVSDYQHGLAMSDLRYGMGEEDAGRVMRHLENAHAAHAGGDHGSAVDSLINAKNSAIYGSGHTRALQNVIRSAISHQDAAGATAQLGRKNRHEDEDAPYFIGGSTIRQDRIADRNEE